MKMNLSNHLVFFFESCVFLNLVEPQTFLTLHATQLSLLSPSEAVPSTMPLAAVENLSDEERCNDRGPVNFSKKRGRPRLPRYKKKRLHIPYQNVVDRKQLRYVVSSRCGCKCGCFKPFSDSDSLFDEYAKLRSLMAKMTKLEKDDYAMGSVSIDVAIQPSYMVPTWQYDFYTLQSIMSLSQYPSFRP